MGQRPNCDARLSETILSTLQKSCGRQTRLARGWWPIALVT